MSGDEIGGIENVFVRFHFGTDNWNFGSLLS